MLRFAAVEDPSTLGNAGGVIEDIATLETAHVQVDPTLADTLRHQRHRTGLLVWPDPPRGIALKGYVGDGCSTGERGYRLSRQF